MTSPSRATTANAFLRDVPVLLRDTRGHYLMVLSIGTCGICGTMRACFISRNGRSSCCECDKTAGAQ